MVRRKRKVWVKPGRTEDWWMKISNGKMHPEEWKINFRLNETEFYRLVNMLRPFANDGSTKVRKDSLTLAKKVAITLYYLKDQGSMKMTANSFGIARCTVGCVIQEICNLISEKIGPILINFPSEKDAVINASSRFLQKFGFPQVIGCVDGTHIPIKQPTENSHDYFSYKMSYTLNCQAICDANGKFTNVEIKWPGSVHDARVFANCRVQQNFTSSIFKLYYKDLLPGHEYVPQLLLGDPAYPLLPYLMKEYDHCSSNEEVIFNQMLRSARNMIECAFGRLKARWRILMRPMDIPVDKLPNIIYACFVLHNFCEEAKVEVDGNMVEKIIQEERRFKLHSDKLNSYTSLAGRKVRETVTKYFKEYL